MLQNVLKHNVILVIVHPNRYSIAVVAVVVVGGGGGDGGDGGVVFVGVLVLVNDCLTKRSHLVCPQLAPPKIDLDKQQHLSSTTMITTIEQLRKFTSSKFLSTSANREDSMEDRLTPLKSILDQEGGDGD